MKPETRFLLLCLLSSILMSCAPVGRIESLYSGRVESPPRILLEIGLSLEAPTILDGRLSKDDSVPPPSSGGQTVRWELRRRDGALAESGAVQDPRWYHWDSIGPDGRLEGGMKKGPFGVLRLNVPAVEGEIRLFEMDGEEIGRLDFDPGQWLAASDGHGLIGPWEQILPKPEKKPGTSFRLAILKYGPAADGLGAAAGGRPPPFGVDGDGRVFILVAAKRRVVRLDAYGSFDAEFPVTGEGEAVDLVVEDHGMFSVLLKSGAETLVAYHDDRGRPQAVSPLPAGYGPPFYMTRNNLWARDEKRGGFHPVMEGKWGVVKETERQRLGFPGLPCIFPGPPRALGSATVSIVSARQAEAKLFDGKGRLATRTIMKAPARLLGVPVLAPLHGERLVVIFKLQGSGYLAGSLGLAAQLQIQDVLAIDASRHGQPFRELAVDGQGRIYQLIPGRSGIEIRRHRFPPRADRVLAKGDWVLEINYWAKGTRSEGQHGTLLYKGEVVRAANTGEIIATDLGEMKYYGDPSVRVEWLRYQTGWNFARLGKVPRADEP